MSNLHTPKKVKARRKKGERKESAKAICFSKVSDWKFVESDDKKKKISRENVQQKENENEEDNFLCFSLASRIDEWIREKKRGDEAG